MVDVIVFINLLPRMNAIVIIKFFIQGFLMLSLCFLYLLGFWVDFYLPVISKLLVAVISFLFLFKKKVWS